MGTHNIILAIQFMMDSAEGSSAGWRRLDVARRGHGGSSPEEGGNGALMDKLDGFLSYGGNAMWGAHLGGFRSM
jgi:hypothetical protein